MNCLLLVSSLSHTCVSSSFFLVSSSVPTYPGPHHTNCRGSPSVQGPPTPAPPIHGALLVTTGGQTLRPVQTCTLENPLVLTSGGSLLKHVRVKSILLECFLVIDTFIPLQLQLQKTLKTSTISF